MKTACQKKPLMSMSSGVSLALVSELDHVSKKPRVDTNIAYDIVHM